MQPLYFAPNSSTVRLRNFFDGRRLRHDLIASSPRLRSAHRLLDAFNWDVSQSALTLSQVKQIHQSPGGVRGVL